MRRIAAAVVVSVLCVGALVGCSPSEPDMPGMTASPTGDASPEPSPTPTVSSAGPRDLSDPELGVVFTDFPRDQDDETAAAIQTYMQFEIEYWRALTTNTVPAGPWAIATDELIAWVSAQVDPNAAAGWAMDGTLSSSISVVSVDATRAVLDVCRDWNGASFVHPDGTTIRAVDNGTDPLSTIRFGMEQSPTGWRISSHEKTVGC